MRGPQSNERGNAMTRTATMARRAFLTAFAVVTLAVASLFGAGQAAWADETTDESSDVVFTVCYAEYSGADEEVVKEYTAEEFDALIQSDRDATYATYSKSGINVRATTTYVTIDEILADCGITLDRSTTISIGASADDFYTTFTYATYCDNQYFYPNYSYESSDMTEAISGLPIAVSNYYGYASSTTEIASAIAVEALAAQTSADEFQLIVPQNSDSSNAGKVQVGGVDTIIVSSSYGRLSGDTRYGTMLSIVEAAFDQAGSVYSKNIVVASGANYPDALAASGYAGLDLSIYKYTRATPIVLTKAAELTEEAADAIEAVVANNASCADASDIDDPVTITIVGGEDAVSADVEAAIEELVGDDATVVRVSGDNRVETSIALYEAGEGWSTTAYLVAGFNYADALSISSAAYANGSAIFLANKSGDVTESLYNELYYAYTSGAITDVVIVGGESAVSADAQEALESIFGAANVTRISGENRYATSSVFADYAVENLGLSYDTVVLATGAAFPDALAASALAGVEAAPILLVNDSDNGVTCITGNISDQAEVISVGFVIGGTSAVSADIYDQVRAIIYG